MRRCLRFVWCKFHIRVTIYDCNQLNMEDCDENNNCDDGVGSADDDNDVDDGDHVDVIMARKLKQPVIRLSLSLFSRETPAEESRRR